MISTILYDIYTYVYMMCNWRGLQTRPSAVKWLMGNYCGYHNNLPPDNEEGREICNFLITVYIYMCIDICTSTQCMNIYLELVNAYYT